MERLSMLEAIPYLSPKLLRYSGGFFWVDRCKKSNEIFTACKGTNRTTQRRFKMKEAKTDSSKAVKSSTAAAKAVKPVLSIAEIIKRLTNISLTNPPISPEEWGEIEDVYPEAFDMPVLQEEAYSAWIYIPSLVIGKIPLEWSIEFKFKNETVTVKGPSDSIFCGNIAAENQLAFKLLAKALAHSEDENKADAFQPHKADECAPKMPAPKIGYVEANSNEISFEITENDGKTRVYDIDFIENYEALRPLMKEYIVPEEKEPEQEKEAV
jgi:hypothetical protein